MITLIIGGSGSGKSAFAEEYALSWEHSNAYYLATMEVRDQESRERVQRHRQNRRAGNWITLEHPRNVGNAVNQLDPKNSVLLLECMSNLVANEMYQEHSVETAAHCASQIIQEIRILSEVVDNLVIVSNNVFDDGNTIDEDLQEYFTALGDVNQLLAEEADEVIEVVVGIPVYLKRGAIHNDIHS